MTITELVSLFSRYVKGLNEFRVTQVCGLAEGTNNATLKTTNKIVYYIYNKEASKAPTDNIAMTACAEQEENTFCYYLVSINTAGSVTVTKGSNNDYVLPPCPPFNIPIGAFKVVTGSASSFTSGTTDLSASGITTTFYDIDCGMAMQLINQAQRQLERGVSIVHNGAQVIVQNWDHMLARADSNAIHVNATTVTFPFPNFKCFADRGIVITDSVGCVEQMEKRDFIPSGRKVYDRPRYISRLPAKETTFSPDKAPEMEFSIYPYSNGEYTISAIIYQYSPELDNVIYQSNWLTENAPDVLLFGALIEWASYIPHLDQPDSRLPEWQRRYNDAVWTLYQAQRKEKYKGSYIYTRFFNPLNVTGGGISIVTGRRTEGALITEGGDALLLE